MVGQPDVDAGQQRGGAVFSGSQSSVGVAAADLGFDGLEIADEGHAFLGNRRGSGSGDLDKLAARVMVWIPPFARPQRWRKLGGMRNKQEVFMSHRNATAMVASTRDPNDYKSDRHFPAWLGLVPRQNSTGGVDRLGGISKRGNGYLRRLLIHGSRSIMRWRSKSMDLACKTAWAQARQCCDSCGGEQNSAHYLGNHEVWRRLWRTCKRKNMTFETTVIGD